MQANNFRHQDYALTPEAGQFELMQADRPKSEVVSSDRLVVSDVMQRNKVAAIFLVHGTYAGDDILGIFRKVATVFPSLAVKLSRLEKKSLDALLSDTGNYTTKCAAQMSRTLNRTDDAIEVALFRWTGENSHIGRGDGAVRLLDQLLEQSFATGSRVQLWGHSHGGNVLALLTNLLGADLAHRRQFFNAAAPFHKRLFRAGSQTWNRVRDALLAEGNPLEHISLDVATFGTPVRYGWDVNAVDRLWHFVNHRPADGLPVYQAALPRSLDDILNARFGDVVQQLAVAGTGVSPGLWSWRSRIANRRLRRLLQKGVRRRDLLHRLKLGKRVADAGKTLLVDYNQPDASPLRLEAGHAVYTTNQWQDFHIEQVVRRCYQEPSSATNSSDGN